MTSVGDQTTVNRLRELVAKVLEVDLEQVTENALFYEELEVDSLHKTEISASVEREFRVRFAVEEWASVHTVTDMMNLLREKSCQP